LEVVFLVKCTGKNERKKKGVKSDTQKLGGGEKRLVGGAIKKQHENVVEKFGKGQKNCGGGGEKKWEINGLRGGAAAR